jgi:1-aminocyclopropane-1-carboxylate deaminase/D-cysteine desulfhydrase-like pyridoxal-dependent ACC family enzyme
MQAFQNLNSPLQHLDTINGVEIWLKREDLIHPHVSGNKWRKLKYYLQDFRESNKTSMLTFGGAFSNHLSATAAMGRLAHIPTKALVRGEEVTSNVTLDFCREQGMEVESISRKQYDTKDEPEFLQLMEENLPEVYIIPEGGKGVLGIKGCTEILNEVPAGFDYVCCAGGTGTTMAGLLLSGYVAQYLLFPALKGGVFLKRAIALSVLEYEGSFSTAANGKEMINHNLAVDEIYHFGGYGKVKPELIDFMNGFYQHYKVALDPIYTGKMMYGIMAKIDNGEFEKGTRLLAIHTGGLQGIKGMNQRLEKSGNRKLEYED